MPVSLSLYINIYISILRARDDGGGGVFVRGEVGRQQAGSRRGGRWKTEGAMGWAGELACGLCTTPNPRLSLFRVDRCIHRVTRDAYYDQRV